MKVTGGQERKKENKLETSASSEHLQREKIFDTRIIALLQFVNFPELGSRDQVGFDFCRPDRELFGVPQIEG
ncbi:MAG TPA: hypothetical protein VNL14_15735 [Candidatus Acidoferrales bacterium]|nr:hypothetical protein [Candidatus Acidoferrales bacterium]